MHVRPSRSVRVQAVLAAAWASLCLVMVLQSAQRLGPAHVRVLWTYFAPCGPPLLMLWLWAAAVAHWEREGVPYDACFAEHERRCLAPSRDLFALARAVSCVALAGLALCAQLCARPAAAAAAALLVPPVLYGALLALLVAPVNALRRRCRLFFLRTLWRVLVPVRPVSWADFLLADVLTSLAKSSSDSARSLCLMMHGPLAHPSHPSSGEAAASCGPLTALSLAALVLPFTLRLVQCLSVWRAGGPRTQLFNALKYASSLPALLLTALEHDYHVQQRPFPWRRAWLLTMALNSAYSFYWDVEQDWDMPWLAQHGGGRVGPLRVPALKGNHAYSEGWYSLLLWSNLALRLSWAHRLLGDLEAHDAVLMAVALLEVVRRYNWLFVRCESELRKLGLLVGPTPEVELLLAAGGGGQQRSGSVSSGGGGVRSASADGAAVPHAAAAAARRGRLSRPDGAGLGSADGAGGGGGAGGAGGGQAVAPLGRAIAVV